MRWPARVGFDASHDASGLFDAERNLQRDGDGDGFAVRPTGGFEAPFCDRADCALLEPEAQFMTFDDADVFGAALRGDESFQND